MKHETKASLTYRWKGHMEWNVGSLWELRTVFASREESCELLTKNCKELNSPITKLSEVDYFPQRLQMGASLSGSQWLKSPANAGSWVPSLVKNISCART